MSYNTCMSSRAVHIEVAETLDTSSCINAIRQFIARRGLVKEITSDNGTNLVNNELNNELRHALRELKEDDIQTFDTYVTTLSGSLTCLQHPIMEEWGSDK